MCLRCSSPGGHRLIDCWEVLGLATAAGDDEEVACPPLQASWGWVALGLSCSEVSVSRRRVL